SSSNGCSPRRELRRRPPPAGAVRQCSCCLVSVLPLVRADGDSGNLSLRQPGARVSSPDLPRIGDVCPRKGFPGDRSRRGGRGELHPLERTPVRS
ncbi:unnamed protein product, partial [Ectocarpus sp. 8 AP-2014]